MISMISQQELPESLRKSWLQQRQSFSKQDAAVFPDLSKTTDFALDGTDQEAKCDHFARQTNSDLCSISTSYTTREESGKTSQSKESLRRFLQGIPK